MFVNNNDQQQNFETLTPGTHRMKVTGYEFKETGSITLTFSKGGFKTNAFFKTPNLKEDGTPESWAKVVGPSGGWFVSTKLFFESVMGKGETNRVINEVSARVTAKCPTFEEQFASLEIVNKAVNLLLKSWFEAATPFFKDVWFDVDLVETIGIDKEGNEKTYLNVAKGTAENGWKVPYRVSTDQTNEEAPAQDNPEDNVPEWVNETLQRQEPVEDW